MGALLIAWTARGAVACWVVKLLRVAGRFDRVPARADVVWNTAGWLLLVAHVLCAFHVQHGWSHAQAYAHTAQQTARIVGWNWGGGVYANYATVAVWGVGVLLLVRARVRQSKVSSAWNWFETAWIGFIMLNATVVFGPGRWWSPVGGIVIGLVILTCYRRRHTARQNA